jgi:DNA-directed RNA polymerase specialized sigma24 family protein
VAELLLRLPPDRRLILVLKRVHGYTAQEVADRVGLPLPDVQYQIKKGRGQLRRWVLKDSALRELFPGVAS